MLTGSIAPAFASSSALASASTPSVPLPGGVSVSAPIVPLEVPADANTCSPCGREALRHAFVEQARDQRAMEADVSRQVAASYAASRPA